MAHLSEMMLKQWYWFHVQVEDKLRTAGMKAGELGDFLTGKAKKAFSAAERTAKEIMVKTTNSIKRKPLSSPNDTTGLCTNESACLSPFVTMPQHFACATLMLVCP